MIYQNGPINLELRKVRYSRGLKIIIIKKIHSLHREKNILSRYITWNINVLILNFD